MDERPKKRRGPLTWLAHRTWRFWVVAAVLLPVLYVASFGLSCWIAAVPEKDLEKTASDPARAWLYVYQPIGWTVSRYSHTKDTVQWFAGYFIPYGCAVLIPIDRDYYTGFFYSEWARENGIDQWEQLIDPEE